MDLKEFKRLAVEGVEAQRKDLIELSLKIHANPELAFQEVKASRWLSEYLEANGFCVERGICDLPTAFKASYGSGRPVVGILGEYDALPHVGHGCGHNIMGTSAVGAGVALKTCIERLGGQVVVFGTPAEESVGGKIIMAAKSAFDDIDVAMIVHPSVRSSIYARSLACISLDVHYHGRAAHASSRPEEGINALDALILAFNGIGALRQHIRGDARVHGIVTNGGEAPNIVPAHASGSFLIRAASDDYLGELQQKVLGCFEGAARVTGARLEYRWGAYKYSAMRTNIPLAQAFGANLEELGHTIEMNHRRVGGLASTDMGNVSVMVPSIHPWIAIAPRSVLTHSSDFAAAAASEEGHVGLVDSAKAMAMTAIDVIARPDLLAKVKDSFLSDEEPSWNGNHGRV